MRVLVTGGAGYIGSHLVDALHDAGHEVRVLDNLSTGKAANLEHRLDEVRLVNGSILDAPLVEREVEWAQIVFHLAAAVGVRHIVDDPLNSLLTNTRGTEIVLNSCFRYWRKAVVASTSEVYGKTSKVPIREDDDRVLGPTTVHRWSYATAKAIDEHLAFAFAANSLPISIVRYFNSYGPRLDERGYGSVVANFIRQAKSGDPLTVHGDGQQSRCFTYIDDTIRGTMLAGLTSEAEGQVFNLGATRETTILELAEMIKAAVGSDSPIESTPYENYYGPGFEDTRRRVPDVSRARELLDWEPEVALEDGLARTIEWWQKTMPESESPFDARVDAREVVVGVVGLGYVGLPLCVSFAESGFRTVGFDIDAERANALNQGQSHIDDVSSERVAAAVVAGRFEATSSPSDLASVDVVFICVPTPFDKAKTPDLSYVRDATNTVAEILRPGMLVILQSTTYPGTTTEIVQPVLEQRGLRAGQDFFLAFSPERVDPGNTTWTVHNTPKVVGGVTPACTERACALLEAVMDDAGLVHPVGGPATAEMAKLLENTYRAVNVALVNEMAMLAHEMGIDPWEVIDAAATKPFGFQAFYPGIGPGGHCIPVDPHYLSWKAREFDFQTKFIEVAADVNSGMARYVVGRVQDMMNRREASLRGARVLCLGAAFKPGVSDVRNSRAIRVMELLEDAGAVVDYADPHVPTLQFRGTQRKSTPIADIPRIGFDLVVVLVGAPDWPLDELDAAGIPVFDAVNAGGGGGQHRERL